jgi:allophanate hydrolase
VPGRARVPQVDLVVVGAHLSGQPLNGILVACGATLVAPVQTAATYRLWALDTIPPRPGLLRVVSGGAAVAGERWRMSATRFGTFVAALTAPMTIGPVVLADGSTVPGFLVEAAATQGAVDITRYGSWRSYLAGSASSAAIVSATTRASRPISRSRPASVTEIPTK